MTNNSNGNRLERIETALEVITQAVNQKQQQIATAFEAIDRLANVQLQLGQIVDYLMRRDQNGNEPLA